MLINDEYWTNCLEDKETNHDQVFAMSFVNSTKGTVLKYNFLACTRKTPKLADLLLGCVSFHR